MEISVLGPVEVTSDSGVGATVGGPRMRRLVAVLALADGSLRSIDSLADAVWGDASPPIGVRRTLMSYVSRLRLLLPDGAIQHASSGYRLSLAAVNIDASRFGAEVMGGQTASGLGDAVQACIGYDSALRRWRGDPLGEFVGEHWAEPDRVRLQELWPSATEGSFEAKLVLGQTLQITADLERAALATPNSDRLQRLLMVALYRSGRQVDALQHFQRVRRQLIDLGLEPSSLLRETEQRILDHDKQLGAGWPLSSALVQAR